MQDKILTQVDQSVRNDIFELRRQESGYRKSTRPLFVIFSIYTISIWLANLLSVGSAELNLNLGVIALGFLLILQQRPIPALVLDRFARGIFGAIFVSVVALSLLSIASFLHAESPFRVGRPLLTYVQYFFITLAMVLCLDQSRQRFVYNLVIACAAGVAAITALGYVIPGIETIVFGPDDRAAGFFKNPNQLGIALSTVAPMVLANAMIVPKGRLLGFLAYILLGIALIASGSKTNLLLYVVLSALLAAATAFLSGNPARSLVLLVRNVLMILIVVIAGAAALESLNPRAARILDNFVTGAAEVPSVNQRLLLWREGLAIGADRPFLGEGAGQFASHEFTSLAYTHSHNLFVEYFRTLGLPGLAAVIVLVLAVLLASLNVLVQLYRLPWQHQQPADRAHALGLAFAAWAFIASSQLSDSLGPTTTPVFWITMTLLILKVRRSAEVSSVRHVRTSRIAVPESVA